MHHLKGKKLCKVLEKLSVGEPIPALPTSPLSTLPPHASGLLKHIGVTSEDLLAAVKPVLVAPEQAIKGS